MLAVLFQTQVARADCEPEVNDHFNDRQPCSYYEEAWKESNVVIPPVSAASEFQELAVADASPLYRYYLAQDSISRGANGVMRYTVAVVSKTGVRNIFYEGLRCATDEVKTYAYATNRGAFRRSGQSKWRPIANKGIRAYQDFLVNVVICGTHGFAWDADKARQALLDQVTKNGLRQDSGCRDCENGFRSTE